MGSGAQGRFEATRGRGLLTTWRIIPVVRIRGEKNHGEYVSPQTGVGPLPNGLNTLQMGVTNYLLTGMILQVSP